MPSDKVPAVQYLRMSTEHQQYSIENQSRAIARYAHDHGFEIVKSYVDAGKTGVILRHRAGLQQLLADVVSGEFSYKVILVYDISRWGRFQDIDEAAHYEFICRQAGLALHYCAEQFPNDGTLPSSILKALKRTMAAEYSRELSVKVYQGKKAAVERGCWVGGQAGYGLQRLMVSENGTPKELMRPGQKKNLSTDRVILVPGRPEEIECVRLIFDLARYVGTRGVASWLNDAGVRSPGGVAWTEGAVYRLLRNPKYCGCNAWGKSCSKLYGPQTRIKRQDWITCPGAFQPLVSPELYEQTWQAVRSRKTGCTDDELIGIAKRLLREHRRLTMRMLGQSGKPTSVFRNHFGNFRKLYDLVGYSLPSAQMARTNGFVNKDRLRKSIEDQIIALHPGRVQMVQKHARRTLIVDGHVKVTTVVCGRLYQTKTLGPRWHLVTTPTAKDCAVLLCLADRDYTCVEEMYLMPDMDKWKDYKIKWQDPWLARGTRIASLDEFCEAALLLASSHVQTPSLVDGWMPHCLFGRGVVTSVSKPARTTPISNKGRCTLIVELDPPEIYVKTNVYVLGAARTDRYRRNLPTSIDGEKPVRLHWVYTNGTVLKCQENIFGRLLQARTLTLWIRPRSGRVPVEFELSGLADAIASLALQAAARRQLREEFKKRTQ